jgi:predicted DNA-binding protein with PD1-like motif
MKIEKVSKDDIKNYFFLRLNPGDDLLEELRRFAGESGIQNAVILSGIGSVTSHHYHVVSTPVNPPENAFTRGDAPADIVNINGFIINGRVHAHVIFSDTRIAYGGHLEKGVRVLTFSILTIVEIDRNFDQWDTVGKIEELLA